MNIYVCIDWFFLISKALASVRKKKDAEKIDKAAPESESLHVVSRYTTFLEIEQIDVIFVFIVKRGLKGWC